METKKADWQKLLGCEMVYNSGNGTLELTTEGNIRNKDPFCIKKNGSSLIYFNENVVQDAYKGRISNIYFVDENGGKITNFLTEEKGNEI